jgi:hypothetical protein
VLLPGGLLQTPTFPAAYVGHSSVTKVPSPVLESTANLTCEASQLLGTACPTAAPSSASTARPHPAVGGVNPKTWTDLTSEVGTAPSPRYLGAMVYDPVDHYVLLFGGDDGATAYSDTWTFSHDQWTELSINGPSGRYVAGIAWDAADGYAVLFGGFSGTAGSAAFNDTWTYVHGTWTNITGTTNQSPTGRWRQVMTYDAGDGYVLMYGGTNGPETVSYNDTWEFLHGNWTNLTVTGNPPYRFRASMVYDPVDNYTVVFGGCTTKDPASCAGAGTLDSSTWEYHNRTWSALSPTTHPSARIYYGLTYSPIAQTVLLYGGSTTDAASTDVTDTWNFTGGNWTSLTSSLTRSPPDTAYMMMAFDPVDGFTLMFGGEYVNSTWSDATWALGPSILGEVSISPGAVDLGQTVTINATPIAHPGYVSYNYTTLPPGCTSANLSILSCTPSGVGTFPIDVVLNDSGGAPSTENATLAVNPDPAIASFAASVGNVTVGSVVSLSTNATGGTGVLSYRYSGLPPGCSSLDKSVLNCTPTSGGSFDVEVNVTDATHYFVTSSLSVVVDAQPAFTEISALPPNLDVGQSLHITSLLTGGTAPIEYSWTGLPPGCTPTDAPSITCTPTGSSTGPVGLAAVDADGWAASTSVTVVVAPDPTFTSGNASPGAIDVGTTVHLWANVTGGTGAYTFLYTGEPAGCTLGNSPANSCVPTVTGAFTVEAEVTDSTGFSTFENFSFSVNGPVALAGVSASPSAIDLGQNVTFSALPLGGTAPYSFDYVGLPTGCTAAATSNSTTCVPRIAGSYTVTVTVKDALGQSTTSHGTVVVHPDPTISAFGPSVNPTTLGSSVQILTNATNGSSVYSYDYRGLPTGCVTGNTSALACTPTATGNFIVTVTVHDSLGEMTTAQAYVNVTAKTSSSILGLPATTFDLLLIGLVALIVIVAAVVLLRRRKAPPPEPVAPEAWAEEPPA